MGRRSDHSRDELELLALDAATRAVAANGIDGLTIRGVAHDIGYSPGTLYNLFDNRDDLILRVAGQALDTLVDMLGSVEAGRGRDGLHDLFDTFLTFLDDHGRLWEAVQAAKAQEGQRSVAFWQMIVRLADTVRRQLSDAIPGLPRHTAMKSALTLCLSLNGLLASVNRDNLLTHTQTDVEDLARDLIDRYVFGLEAAYAGQSQAAE